MLWPTFYIWSLIIISNLPVWSNNCILLNCCLVGIPLRLKKSTRLSPRWFSGQNVNSTETLLIVALAPSILTNWFASLSCEPRGGGEEKGEVRIPRRDFPAVLVIRFTGLQTDEFDSTSSDFFSYPVWPYHSICVFFPLSLRALHGNLWATAASATTVTLDVE